MRGDDAMKRALAFLLAISSAAIVMPGAFAQHAVSDKALMNKLKGAAPERIVNDATIMNMDADGKMKVVKEGKNGWTCMDPDGHSPMCADKGAMDWAQAWQTKSNPPQTMGFIYMLRGDNGASNTDPYATKATADNNWIKTGAHVMIVGAGAKSMLEGYPREVKADPKKPYVMWSGTPYEHLMLPVK
jgi:hypothetical protein